MGAGAAGGQWGLQEDNGGLTGACRRAGRGLGSRGGGAGGGMEEDWREGGGEGRQKYSEWRAEKVLEEEGERCPGRDGC